MPPVPMRGSMAANRSARAGVGSGGSAAGDASTDKERQPAVNAMTTKGAKAIHRRMDESYRAAELGGEGFVRPRTEKISPFRRGQVLFGLQRRVVLRSAANNPGVGGLLRP